MFRMCCVDGNGMFHSDAPASTIYNNATSASNDNCCSVCPLLHNNDDNDQYHDHDDNAGSLLQLWMEMEWYRVGRNL